MRPFSLSAVSCLLYVASSSASSVGHAHGEAIVQRSSHKALARDFREAHHQERDNIPSTLERKSTRKRDGKVKRMCRIRNTNSTSLTATPSGASTASTSRATSTRASTASGAEDTATIDNHVPNSPWKLTAESSGKSFFDNWDFWSYPDPTHGAVEYQDRDSSFRRGLAFVDGDGYAWMKPEDTQNVGNRASVRIHSQRIFNGNTLVILDAVHMPTGCGTWPAFWSNGPGWPDGGEIDILEGVHDDTVNQASIHTGSGCSIPGSTIAVGQLVGGNNCAAYESGNSGCGFRDTTYQNNYGAPFNNNGGGVYAMQWVDGGISVYFFPRNNIPSDITAGKPNPDSWHAPIAHWGSSQCNPATFFHDHFAIFDLTFCGDWAGNTWWNGCAAKTGYNSCEDYVRNKGDAFGEAYWKVKYVRWYNLQW